jgi:murein DD-endopeptidase MepM/ murein hydrolase activator NlpD
MITIDLGDGQFAYYMHLQPGSLRVKAGERVRRGQVLARVGCSGDAREPHLHFELTDSPKLIAGEGLP